MRDEEYSTLDSYAFLTEKEFLELDDEDKVVYLENLLEILKKYKIYADKNCNECEEYHLTPADLNVDFFFEDWRSCAEHCDECGKEEKINMCDLQFQLLSTIAEELNILRVRLNAMTKLLMRKSDKAREAGDRLARQLEESEKSETSMYG